MGNESETKLSREELFELAKERAEIARQALSGCLKDEKYREYRKRYLDAEKVIVDGILEYVNPNPVDYAFEIQKRVAMLGPIRQLKADLEGKNASAS